MDRPGTIAYLGPPGTFTEQALLSQTDLAEADLVAHPTIGEVLGAVAQGGAEMGFVPMENSIEGTVNATVDALVFEHDLLVQREVVLDIHIDLLAPPGTGIGDVARVISYPHASGQCRAFLASRLPGAEVVAASSTADAARLLAMEHPSGTAALAPGLAAKLYGLEVIEQSVEDHHGDQTRFVAVARGRIAAPTGHDRTSIACFQHTDRPGSLHAILGQFAARDLNLTKIESRPTKRRLGHYCFIIDLEGHIADEVVADCLRDLHASLAEVKFLGSYPAAGEAGPAARREAEAAWHAADAWIASLRAKIDT